MGRWRCRSLATTLVLTNAYSAEVISDQYTTLTAPAIRRSLAQRVTSENRQDPQDAAASVSLTAQRFGSEGSVPLPPDFEEEESGSFSSDDGWFFRTYNKKGYLSWTHHPRDAKVGDDREHLRIEYGVEQSESWGGFVDVGRILVNRNIYLGSKEQIDSTGGALGNALSLYNCADATHVRLGYRIMSPQNLVGRAHMRLILLDGSDCADGEASANRIEDVAEGQGVDCAILPGQNLENWYSFNYILDEQSPATSWNELILPWDAFERPGWTGQVGNDSLDMDAIRGWRLEISIDSQGELGSTSEGVIDIDSLSCVGPSGKGDAIISSSFRNPLAADFAAAVMSGLWSERHYQSPLSRNLTSSYILPEAGTLVVNYTVEQSESWGGFIDYSHITPGFYNLSNAEAISLDYEVLQLASTAGRAHLRLILLDGSDCISSDGECVSYPGQSLENYYSFHYMLDTMGERGQIKVPLVGTSDPESPFYRTGWTGVVGNGRLDKDVIRGFRLEISVDSAGEIGSLVSGVVALGNLSAVLPATAGANAMQELPEAKCVFEPDLHLSTEASFGFNRKVEFVGSRCCEICLEDAQCLFAQDTARHCFLSPGLEETGALSPVQLANTEFLRSTTGSYWIDDPVKRGDFCSVCSCDEERGMIDCRERDLAIVPKTFNELWEPKILDLRYNSRLLIIGKDSFQAIATSLQELYLPKAAQFISPDALDEISANVVFEVDREQEFVIGKSSPLNVISSKTESFGDVCCGISDIAAPSSFSFCKLEVFVPGIDSTYVPFLQYVDAPQLREIRPSSSFMSEAAQSPQLCAEYCAISSKCRYFSYDARWKESEHRCNLLASNGTRSEEVCCDIDDFGDKEGTTAGWTSGRPPRTRYEEDDAKVKFSPRQGLVASEQNNFEVHYEITLGADPLRGAVWVEPQIRNTDDFQVTISPQRVALYDTFSTATVQVIISNIHTIGKGMATLVVDNIITSCDAAFTSAPLTELADSGAVYIDVIPPFQGNDQTAKVILPAILVPLFLFTFLTICGYILFKKKRREADSVWRVLPSELKFKPEPEILGRGTFGVVVLAEYRGSPVAVKRVIPPKRGGDNDSTLSSVFSRGQSTKDFELAFQDSAHPNDFLTNEKIDEDQFTDEESGTKSASTKSPPIRGDNSREGLLSGFFQLSTHKNMTTRKATRNRLKQNFISEMRILSKLRHPCITTVMGAIIEDRTEPALVMEFMDRGSLYDLLHNETMILEGELLLPILCDIAQGIRFLHAASPQVIHGDLKCGNILVDGRFRAKVADFGLTQKKQVGKGTGTPYWMAPELLRGERNTVASDVYSFGIILYEVYSRKDPYEGEDYHEVLKLVANPNVNKRPGIPASMPHSMKGLMEECLHALPNKRPTFGNIDQRVRDLDVEMVEPEETHLSLQTRKDRRVLYDVFPPKIADSLREGKKVEPESRELVTIFFSDVVGFTEISSKLSPLKISDMLDRMYTRFDELSRRHDVFKVETIGDAYMAVTNLVKDQPDHTVRIANFAIDAIRAANETPIDIENLSLGCVEIRVGFHSGSVVANVVGRVNPRYCLFGDTVNTASRMESNSETNRIHCSEKSANLLYRQCPEMPLVCRGVIPIKGKGQMQTFWVNEEACRRTTMTNVESFSSSNISVASSSNQSCLSQQARPKRGETKRLRRLSIKTPIDAALGKSCVRPITASV